MTSVEAERGKVVASIEALKDEIKEAKGQLGNAQKAGDGEAVRLWLQQLTALQQQLTALQQEKNLLLEREARLQTAGQPREDPSKDMLMEQLVEMMKQLPSSIASTCEGFLTRIARNQGWVLKLTASTASSGRVKELLRRIALNQSQDQTIPCCTRIDQLPEMSRRFTPYVWSGGEASAAEVEKGKRWLEKFVCPAGVVVIAVQSQTWLEVNFVELDASISASKSDFLFALDSPAVRSLPVNPTPEQLVGVLRDIIGAYETKTPRHLSLRGLMSVWPQVVVEALALNHMASRSEARYFIPVFGGDFTQNLVVHAAPRGDDFILHAASSANQGSTEIEVLYMKYLLQQTKAAIEEARRQDDIGVFGVSALGSAHQYELGNRGTKRERQHDEEDEEDEDNNSSSGRELDADGSMQRRENAYHRDLVAILRHPRMYKALGLEEPPKSIAHSTLEDKLASMRVISTGSSLRR